MMAYLEGGYILQASAALLCIYIVCLLVSSNRCQGSTDVDFHWLLGSQACNIIYDVWAAIGFHMVHYCKTI